MASEKLEVGMIVENPRKKEWGPGRILKVDGARIKVYFRDIEGKQPSDCTKLMGADYLTLANSQDDPFLANLLVGKDGEVGFKKFPLKSIDMKSFFLKRFPLGFDDPGYLKDERDEKWEAHELFEELLGHGQGMGLLSEGNIQELVKRALAVESKVNLLFRNEKMALRDGLHNEASAQEFFEALFGLLQNGRPDRALFESLIDTVNGLPADEDKSSPAKWPVLTVFPFLANPQQFMFLKPDVTKDCAHRMAFDLLYQPQLNWRTYERLLTLSQTLFAELKPLGARDYIDVQSFIWVVGRY